MIPWRGDVSHYHLISKAVEVGRDGGARDTDPGNPDSDLCYEHRYHSQVTQLLSAHDVLLTQGGHICPLHHEVKYMNWK